MQSPWLFFTPAPAIPLAHHTTPPPTTGTPKQSLTTPGHGLIPLAMSPCPPGVAAAAAAAAAILSGGQPHGSPFGTFPPPTPQHHPHHHHHSQLLLAAAAAAYNQQCAATLLHAQPHPATRSQLANGNFHLKLDDVGGSGGSLHCPVKRKSIGEDVDHTVSREIKKAKLETKALKAKRPGFTDERYNETSYYVENGLRKVYPYYFTFTTFTKGRWVGEKILDVFAREFRAHPVEEYERCINSGTLTVNYTKVETDYRLKHNDLLANIVHRHEVPVTADQIEVIHQDDDLVVVNKPASIPVHPCGRYRHNTVVFILAKEHQLKNLRTIHRLDRLTSGLLLFGKNPKKAREMEHQIRNRLVQKEYVCRVEGDFPDGEIECVEPIEVVSYKIGVCKVSKNGKDCRTIFKKLSFNGKTSVVIARPKTGRMHQIRVHLQFLGYPIVNDPLYNHPVFGPDKGKGGITGKSDEELIAELISIHNAENWLGIEGEDGGGGTGSSMSVDFFGPSLPLPKFKDTEESKMGLKVFGNLLSSGDGPPATLLVNPKSSDWNRDMNGIVNEQSTNVLKSDELLMEPEMKELSQQATKSVQMNSPGKVTVGTQTSNDDDSLTTTTHTQTQTNSTKSIVDKNEDIVGCSKSNHDNLRDESISPSSTSSPTFRSEQLTSDPHCYECKVKYRDPKPKDLVMYLHALSYRGPGWCYETKHPAWAAPDWIESSDEVPVL